jgi:hypothetical protein
MDDHFWPAMYPGLVVGILYGLSFRNFADTIFAALGGLIGAAIAYLLLKAANMNDGLPSVAGLVLSALAGAYLLTNAARLIRGRAPRS